MKKQIYLLLFLSAIVFNASGILTEGKILRVSQSDGSSVSISLVGDEWWHYYITTDSIPVFEKNGDFHYAYVINGELTISDIIAHDPDYRISAESKFERSKEAVISFLRDKHSEKINIENSRRLRKTPLSRGGGYFNSYTGYKKGLVILVNFANLDMISDNPKAVFNRIFNEKGYSDNGCVGSVHDYFFDQSYGLFNLTFDITGPVTLKNNYGYYGANHIISGYDKHAYEMVIEACQAVDSSINFKDYDWDGDGSVDQVYIIYAGYGEHAGAPANTIWPHESELGEYAITLDGVTINTYACSCELAGMHGTRLSGIGTPCHEFSHCLGLPDLYDTDYSGAFGMSVWDLMDSGSHGGPSANGEVPYGYSAYERWVSGWLDPVRIDEDSKINSLKNLEESPQAYIIYNEGNDNEFFLLENHQPSKWFQYAGSFKGAHGLMVTHIDYDPLAWKYNIVNPKPDHQRMTIVPADKSYGYSDIEIAGDLFPGSENTTWFTSEAYDKAGGRLFNKNINGSYHLACAITNISEHNGEISFDVCYDYELTVPTAAGASDIDQTGFTANWLPLDNADSYSLEVTAKAKIQGIPVERSQTIDNICGLSHRINWIFDDADTRYRVRAIVHGMPTEWSNYIFVSNPVSVNSVKADAIPENVEFWSLTGVRIKTPAKGINILKAGNSYKKIYIK